MRVRECGFRVCLVWFFNRWVGGFDGPPSPSVGVGHCDCDE